MEITIDIHEDNKKSVSEILKNKGSNNVKIDTLLCGDYYCYPVLVEHKKLPDYVSSVKNELIFQQAQDLLFNQKQNPELKPYIMISGNITDIIKLPGAQAKPLIAAWASLNRQGIPTSFVGSEWFFLHGLLYLFEKYNDGKDREYNPVRKPTELEDYILTNYCSLDGIGEKTAIKLKEKFSTPKKLYNATMDELIQVEGIGKLTAEKLIKFFNGEI